MLDWLVFADRRIAPLAAAVEQGRARWLAASRGRDELRVVLERGALGRRPGPPDPKVVLARFDHLARLCPDPPPAAAVLCCADAADQVFVDLAIATRAQWLITRDKALLALKGRARHLGLDIAPPEDWQHG